MGELIIWRGRTSSDVDGSMAYGAACPRGPRVANFSRNGLTPSIGLKLESGASTEPDAQTEAAPFAAFAPLERSFSTWLGGGSRDSHLEAKALSRHAVGCREGCHAAAWAKTSRKIKVGCVVEEQEPEPIELTQ
jgi:hypothetical protein